MRTFIHAICSISPWAFSVPTGGVHIWMSECPFCLCKGSLPKLEFNILCENCQPTRTRIQSGNNAHKCLFMLWFKVLTSHPANHVEVHAMRRTYANRLIATTQNLVFPGLYFCSECIRVEMICFLLYLFMISDQFLQIFKNHCFSTLFGGPF